MSSINLQGLIDKVLSMAQASVYGRKEDPNYWKDDNDKRAEERRRDTALALGQQAIDAKKEDEWKRRMDLSRYGANDPLVREGMPNASKLDQVREENAGELARKQLGLDFNREELEFNKRKLDVENIRDYYKTDVGAQSAKYTGSAELIKAASARANDTTLLPEQRQQAIDFLNNQYAMANKEARQGLGDAQPAPAAIPASTPPAASIPMPQPKNNSLGDAAVSDVMNKNLPDDFSNFRTPTAPQNTTPSTPATGLGGSIGRGWYGFTHPDEPTRFNGVPSPIYKATNKFVFDTAPKAVANTAIGAVRGVQDFGSNTVLGYEQRKAEEEAKKKRKALY